MSVSNMVADDKQDNADVKLKFDKLQAENSAQNIRIHLMKKNRNHLGLGPIPVGGTVRRLEEWRERNDTCIATIWESCKHDQDVLEVANQYLEEKDQLNQEPLSEELMDRLVNRFRGELGNVLEKTTAEYHSFKIRATEKVSVGVDRLNGIIQKLTKLGQPPTDASKLAKIKASIQIEELHDLWVSVALLPTAHTTFDSVKEACERYDEAKLQLELIKGSSSAGEINLVNDVQCSFCDKKGHTLAECKKAAKKRNEEKFKRRQKREDKNGAGNQHPESADYTGCFTCGSKKHRALECPKKRPREEPEDTGGEDPEAELRTLRAKVRKLEKELKSSKKSTAKNTDWNKYIRKEELVSDSDSN